MLSAALAGTGFEVHAEADGSHVERAAAIFRPDIALIDMRLGDGVDGITVARRLKGTDDFPLLFLTSASAIEDVLAAYDVGGDDYIVKPFVMAELVARMRAVLRRSGREGRSVFELGDLRVDADGHSVVRAGQPVELTHREFALLVEIPGGHDLLLRAAAVRPGGRRRLTTLDLRAGPALSSPSDGSLPSTAALVVPIGVSPRFGCLAVRGGAHDGFSEEDRHFAVQAADILAAALERLTADEDQRLVSLQDPLTGLPNRALILDHLHLALARSQRRPSAVAVLFVDLDHFKLINDRLGHQAGDDLLIAAGQRLRAALRPPDTVGRLGGDEFVAVCEDVGGKADALAVADRLAATLAAPLHLAGRDLTIRASIGVTLSVRDSTDPATLLAEADGAMFWAKRRGHRMALFDERMRIGAEDVLSPAAGLAWLHSGSRIPGMKVSASAGRLLARMADLLEEIEHPERLDLRDLPAG